MSGMMRMGGRMDGHGVGLFDPETDNPTGEGKAPVRACFSLLIELV